VSPSVSVNRNAGAAASTRSGWPSAERSRVAGALVLSIGKDRSIVVTEPIQLRFRFRAVYTPPPTKHADELLTASDIPTNMPRQNQSFPVTASAVQPSAGLPSSHSFHGEVSSSGRLLLSIPLVQLCAAHTQKPRRARFRAPLPAPLRRLTAPPCAPSVGQLFFG
jgi:hypothetical protein